MDKGNISVRFSHPKLELNFLSPATGLSCFTSWKAGSPRQTPKGEPISGNYKDSYWVARLEFPIKTGFQKKFMFVINRLLKARDAVRKIKSSGGTIEIHLQLPGAVNNGDSIDSKLLKTMGDLGVDLAIEVFPRIA